jgi:hypothetical protein
MAVSAIRRLGIGAKEIETARLAVSVVARSRGRLRRLEAAHRGRPGRCASGLKWRVRKNSSSLQKAWSPRPAAQSWELAQKHMMVIHLEPDNCTRPDSLSLDPR